VVANNLVLKNGVINNDLGGVNTDWRDYEQEICDKFQREFNDCEIIKNGHITGKFSKVPRQIDILIQGKMAGVDLLGIVECKYFSRKVDVKVVDSFIGFLEDVGANFGVIITNEGFSAGAVNRASIKGIKLDIVSYEDLELYHYEPDLCQVCDHSYPVLDFHETQTYLDNDGEERMVEIGHCQQCNSFHVKCSCGTINGFYEGQYGSPQECEGACGLEFVVKYEYDSDHIAYETLKVITDSEEHDE